MKHLHLLLILLVALLLPGFASADSAPSEASLTDYLVSVMRRWAPPRTQADGEESALVRYRAIASDVAQVALDPDEKPLWPEDRDRSRTALLVLSVALNESKFKAYVDDGSCNDTDWRKEHAKMLRHEGDCDGGHAYSDWQIHPYQTMMNAKGVQVGSTRVISLKGDSYGFVPRGTLGGIEGSDLLADRVLAARVALHMIRLSVTKTGGLAWYTGEIGRHTPKADVRMQDARDAWTMHPYSQR